MKIILITFQNHSVKVSLFGVILVCIQSKYEKMRTRITPNADTSRSKQKSFFHLQNLHKDLLYLGGYDYYYFISHKF